MKFSAFMLAACCSTQLFAQTKPATMAIVSGTLNNDKAEGIRICTVTDGRKTEYASTLKGAAGKYAFAIPDPAAGLFYLNPMSEGKPTNDYIRIYLKPGEQVQLDIADEKGHFKLVKGGAENLLLNQWTRISDTLLLYGVQFYRNISTYKDFFPELARVLPKAASFKKGIHTPNADFNRLMTALVDQDIELAAVSLICTPRSEHPTREQYPAYYQTILQPNRYCRATEVLRNGEGAELVNRYVNVYTLGMPEAERAEIYKSGKLYTVLCNDTLKGGLIADGMNRYKSYESLQAAVEPVKQYLVLASQKKAYFDAMKRVADFKEGSDAFNFSYPDSAGRKRSLKDMKGKVVVVDVWATWCGPCKGEIPSLQALEEEMKGKDVEFVSISVDEAKDHDKWKQFVAEKQLGGTQLFAAGWSEIAKYYQINGIPRFMVFDKAGKIVNVDAPRPSTPDLKMLIEKHLN